MNESVAVKHKILNLEALLRQRELSGRRGERIVHCHGVFDSVHPGHVRHLQHARRLGERLVVSLAPTRGDDNIAAAEARALRLASLGLVDWVLADPGLPIPELLERFRPDVYVKGSEYERNVDPRFLAERDAVERAGGRVVFTSGRPVAVEAGASASGEEASGGSAMPAMQDPRSLALSGLHQTLDLSATRIERMLKAAAGRRVIVIGEPILDVYVDCDWPRVTEESPILSIRPVGRTSYDGGAAVIALHLAAIGCRVTLLSPLPRSTPAEAMRQRLEAAGVEVHVIDTETPLPIKERYVVGGDKVMKVDHATPLELDHQTRQQFIARAAALADGADAAVVADYGLGMFGPQSMRELFAALRPRVGLLCGDVSGAYTNLPSMHGADWLTPSERELRAALPASSDSLPALASGLMEEADISCLALTLNRQGVLVFRRRPVVGGADGQPLRLLSEHIPALDPAPRDTLGCGDAWLAYSVAARAVGEDVGVAAYLGSLAAAVAGSVAGNLPVWPAAVIDTARQQRTQHAPRVAPPPRSAVAP